MNNFILKHYKIFSFLLGSLCVQALPPFYHWYLLFICFSGVLLFINRASSYRQAFHCGYWFGFGYFAFGLGWIHNALLIEPAQTGWLIPIVFLAAGGFLGLFIGIPALLTHYSKNFPAKYLSLAAWITIFEWLRSWILTGFPWNLFGTCLTFNLELIQTASLWGTYGLSWLTIIIASAPAIWLHHKNSKNLIITICLCGILPVFVFVYGHYRIKNLENSQLSQITFRLVQPNISQRIKWSPEFKQKHFKDYIDLSNQQPLQNIDMVIWGETASPYALDKDKFALQQIKQAIPPTGYLTTGQIRYADDYYGGWKAYNSSLIINNKGTIEDFYDKSHLVPFGEYIPLREWLPDFIKPVANIIGTLKQGNGHKVIKLNSLPSIGLLICYEIIFPHHIFKAHEKPQILINLTNDSWYGISSGPYQHFISAKLRAVEEGITIVRSAGSGISGLIDFKGKVLAQTALSQKAVLDITLPQQLAITTLYNTVGNILILTICILTLIISHFLCNKMQQNKK
ncbi:MAG: apolipoprotein N-acyltransferase [Alphaproteobacteria bacterium]|nr:apolipoprotein N-acyltransferase [Alphaproteobacteria bacterium]